MSESEKELGELPEVSGSDSQQDVPADDHLGAGEAVPIVFNSSDADHDQDSDSGVESGDTYSDSEIHTDRVLHKFY